MLDRIAVDTALHFGKPCVRGTRIPVVDVLELVRARKTFDEIIRDYYPELQPVDIQACLQYAIEVLAIEEVRVSHTA